MPTFRIKGNVKAEFELEFYQESNETAVVSEKVYNLILDDLLDQWHINNPEVEVEEVERVYNEH